MVTGVELLTRLAERRRNIRPTRSLRNPDAAHKIHEPRIAAKGSIGIHPDPGISRALKVCLLERVERLLGVAEINVRCATMNRQT